MIVTTELTLCGNLHERHQIWIACCTVATTNYKRASPQPQHTFALQYHERHKTMRDNTLNKLSGHKLPSLLVHTGPTEANSSTNKRHFLSLQHTADDLQPAHPTQAKTQAWMQPSKQRWLDRASIPALCTNVAVPGNPARAGPALSRSNMCWR